MFPLRIFPLPSELVPLHIFEPRYRQLLSDAEKSDLVFGIFPEHAANESNFGSLMKLERVIKRHQGGESDIIVKCVGLFKLENLQPYFKDKLYPGGLVSELVSNDGDLAGTQLVTQFTAFRDKARWYVRSGEINIWEIATALNLSLTERFALVGRSGEKREKFLISRIEYEMALLKATERSKGVFHLN